MELIASKLSLRFQPFPVDSREWEEIWAMLSLDLSSSFLEEMGAPSSIRSNYSLVKEIAGDFMRRSADSVKRNGQISLQEYASLYRKLESAMKEDVNDFYIWTSTAFPSPESSEYALHTEWLDTFYEIRNQWSSVDHQTPLSRTELQEIVTLVTEMLDRLGNASYKLTELSKASNLSTQDKKLLEIQDQTMRSLSGHPNILASIVANCDLIHLSISYRLTIEAQKSFIALLSSDVLEQFYQWAFDQDLLTSKSPSLDTQCATNIFTERLIGL